MPDPNTTSSPIFWDRLRDLFRRRSGRSEFKEPQPKGRLITICLLVSALIWFVFSMQETHVMEIELATEVSRLPPGYVLTEKIPDKVKLKVEGEGVDLFNVYYKRPIIPVDVSQSVVDFSSAAQVLPNNVRVESIVPRNIIPSTAVEVSKRIPIKFDGFVKPQPTHAFVSPPSLTPDSVTVTGGASLLSGLTEWRTERYTNDRVTDSLSIELSLIDTLDGLVSKSIDRVTLTAPSYEFTGGSRVLELNVVGAPSNDQVITLEPSRITVNYRVLLPEFETARRSPNFYANVSFDDIREDSTGYVTPKLVLPPGLQLINLDFFPSRIKYYYYLRDE